ncbi:exopolyphosphatase [Bacillus solitudinis]|uniref:exopolyphosphatase n=1 Tax=Bacillus solitudinis TaxID=2014074 RepID=UPI001D0D46FB|nr:exopolyphosphatase [Bacillus solitudinis]
MRLVTRSNFDGLVTAMLLNQLNLIDEMVFVHPKDVQDGKVEITANDILTNVPYVEGCGMWFDHHASELRRVKAENFTFKGDVRPANSTTRIVYDYFGGKKKFGTKLDDIMSGVDKAAAANFIKKDILYPKGWVLVSFIMDAGAQTGISSFQNYTISPYQLMEKLVKLCAEKNAIEILEDPDVQERVKRYFELNEEFQSMLKKYSTIYENVIVTDLRGVEESLPSNQFLVYALYPEQNISISIVDGSNNKVCTIACGHSVINKTSTIHVGQIMGEYGGGGQKAAGMCQVAYEGSDDVIATLVHKLIENG